MSKLRLQLEDLMIDSFDTTPVQKGEGDGVRGAVHLLHAVYLPRLPHLRRELQRHLRGKLLRQLRCHLRCLVRGHVQLQLRRDLRRVHLRRLPDLPYVPGGIPGGMRVLLIHAGQGCRAPAGGIPAHI